MSMVDFVYKTEGCLKLKEPEKIENLGVNYDSMIIITQPDEFLKRISNKIKKQGYRIQYAPVSYYSKKDIVCKKITPFDKRERYSYQNEFRIFIDCEKTESVIISIGNIEDIAMMVTKLR